MYQIWYLLEGKHGEDRIYLRTWANMVFTTFASDLLSCLLHLYSLVNLRKSIFSSSDIHHMIQSFLFHIHTHITHFPTLLLPYPSGKSNIQHLQRWLNIPICFTISLHSPPRFSLSPAHCTYRPYGPFPLLLQRVVSSHNHTRTPCFIPLAPPSPFSSCTYTPATFPNSHIHSIYNTIQSFPSTGTHTTAPAFLPLLFHTNLPFPTSTALGSQYPR